MTLSEHYKLHSRKSIKPYSRLFLFAILAIVTSLYTLARYRNTASSTVTVAISKWSIRVNDQEITGTEEILTEPMDLLTGDDSTDIQAGDECYFDIKIDPVGTQVSIAYAIAVDLTSGDYALPNGSTIDHYEIYVGNELALNDTVDVGESQYTIQDECTLVNGQELDENAIRTYRIYCKIPDEADIEDEQELRVEPTITLQQLIEGE